MYPSTVVVGIIPTANLQRFLLPPQVSERNELLRGGLRHCAHWSHAAAA